MSSYWPSYCPKHDRRYSPLFPCYECEKEKREKALADAFREWQRPQEPTT